MVKLRNAMLTQYVLTSGLPPTSTLDVFASTMGAETTG